MRPMEEILPQAEAYNFCFEQINAFKYGTGAMLQFDSILLYIP